MSLKHFHIVFIVFAILISLGFGAWALTIGSDEGVGLRVMGWFSVFLGVGLTVYGAWFWKKSRRVIT